MMHGVSGNRGGGCLDSNDATLWGQLGVEGMGLHVNEMSSQDQREVLHFDPTRMAHI